MMRAAPFREAARTLDTLTRTHRRVGVIPNGDESLRYLLPIPRGWGRASSLGACPAPGQPEILGLFAPQPDLSGPRIIVSATRRLKKACRVGPSCTAGPAEASTEVTSSR